MIDDHTKDELKPEGWEEYEQPESSPNNWSSEKEGHEKIRVLLRNFKSFMEDNFIQGSNSPILSQGAQVIIEALDELPVMYKNAITKTTLNKLQALKSQSQSQDSLEDFTNQYIKEFQNIAKAIDKIAGNKVKRTTCDQKLQKLISSETAKEEIQTQKERDNWNQRLAHAEWVDANLSPKVKLVSSINEALKSARKVDLAESLAQEAIKDGKQAKGFVLPSARKTLNRIRSALSISKNKNKGPQI